MATAGDGNRNHTLNGEAYSIGKLVAGGELPEHEARAMLEAAGHSAGLSTGEVKKTINSAFKSGAKQPRTAPPKEDRLECLPLVNEVSEPGSQEPQDIDFTKAPPKADSSMFPGVIGDAVQAVTENTEAVPVAVAANLIGRIAAMIGRPSKQSPDSPRLYIGDSCLHLRPFFLITGPSSKGRKGTSDKPAERIIKAVDDLRFERHGQEWTAESKSMLEQYWPLNKHGGGLSTGEGLSYFLRDDTTDKDGETVPGQPDKRLFVVEEEFANVLAQCRRDQNTLSATIRRLWDGQTLSPLTKSDRTTATDPHVCINGHVTIHELVEKANGQRYSQWFSKQVYCSVLKTVTDKSVSRKDSAGGNKPTSGENS